MFALNISLWFPRTPIDRLVAPLILINDLSSYVSCTLNTKPFYFLLPSYHQIYTVQFKFKLVASLERGEKSARATCEATVSYVVDLYCKIMRCIIAFGAWNPFPVLYAHNVKYFILWRRNYLSLSFNLRKMRMHLIFA